MLTLSIKLVTKDEVTGTASGEPYPFGVEKMGIAQVHISRPSTIQEGRGKFLRDVRRLAKEKRGWSKVQRTCPSVDSQQITQARREGYRGNSRRLREKVASPATTQDHAKMGKGKKQTNSAKYSLQHAKRSEVIRPSHHTMECFREDHAG